MEDEQEEFELPVHLRPYTDVIDALTPLVLHAEVRERFEDEQKLRALTLRACPSFVEELFQSVYRTERLDSGCVQHEISSSWFRRWLHRSVWDVEVDENNLTIDREMLRHAVGEYLKRPQLRTDYLDWYCADTLIYQEYLGTFAQAEAWMSGWMSRILISGRGLPSKIGRSLLRLSWFAIKWLIWVFVLFVFVDEFSSGWVPFIFVALTVAHVGNKLYRRRKISKLLIAMRAAYDVFQSRTFSWEIAWLELNRARELGAVWSGELYRLVELRKNQR
jgi:hypothetical protein